METRASSYVARRSDCSRRRGRRGVGVAAENEGMVH